MNSLIRRLFQGFQMEIEKTIQISFLALIFSIFSQCSEYENRFKNLFPTDNSPAQPKVIASLPSPGQRNVPKNQKIIITFNKEVDSQTCISAFSMQPNTTGLFEFTGPVMTFTPSREFSGAITYVANLTNRCEDKNGRDLESNYFIDFSVNTDVTQPRVISIQSKKNSSGCLASDNFVDLVNFETGVYANSDVCSNSSLKVFFSKPMDRGSVEANFLVVPQNSGAFLWRDNNTNVEFIPNESFSPGITYVLTVSNQAQDSSENPIARSYTASFTVGAEVQKPQIARVDGYIRNSSGCNPGSLASTLFEGGLRNAQGVCSSIVQGNQNSPIFIDFTESIDLTTADSMITITPTINGVKTWSTSNHPLCGTTGACGSSSRLTFTPIEPWQHSITYTLSIASNARDLIGNRVGENFSYNFTIGNDFQIPRVSSQDGSFDNGGGCSPGILASLIDATNGIRNRTGVCSGLISGASNTPLFIHFTEDMNQTSVENGFSISPAINGTRSWSTSTNSQCGSTGPCGTSSLLTFTPSVDWQNATYFVNLNGSILDTGGNTLGTNYTFSFTVGTDLTPPKLDFATGPILGDISPMCGGLGNTLLPNFSTNVCHLSTGNRLRVRFTESMDQGKTTGAFSLSPNVNGIISWPNPNELLFTPSQNFSLFSQYRLSINTNASDISGNKLASDFVSFFTTGDGGGGSNFPPSVLNINSDTQTGAGGCDASIGDSLLTSFVNNVCTDNNGSGAGAVFEFVFSKNMDQNSTAQAFSISPSVSGFISWTSATTMRFVTTQSLTPSNQYTITINTGARDTGGTSIESNFIRFFNTSTTGGFLALNSISLFTGGISVCQSGSGILTNTISSVVNSACTGNPITNPILFTFSQPLNQSTVNNGISFSPSISGFFSFPASNQAQFNPDTGLQFGRRYSITVSPSVQNSSGRGLQNSSNSSFVVGALDTTAPTVIGVDFEQSDDGDGCVGTPNDLVNQNNGASVTNICNNRPLLIHFSEPMDSSSITNSISISPFINLSFSASGNDLTVTPVPSFSSNELYTLTISTNAKDLAGNSLSSSFIIQFRIRDNSPKIVAIGVASQSNCLNFTSNSFLGSTTGGNWTLATCFWSEGMQVLSPTSYRISPGGVSACPANSNTDDIRIIFNQSMNPVNTVNAVSMSYVSRVGGSSVISKNSWTWSDNFHVLTIQFTDATACGNDLTRVASISDPGFPFYLIQIDQTARSATGLPLSTAFSFLLEGD